MRIGRFARRDLGLQSVLQSSYSTTLCPLSQCSTVRTVTTRRVWVPVIEGPHNSGRCAVECVGRRGRGQAIAAVRRIRVIEQWYSGRSSICGHIRGSRGRKGPLFPPLPIFPLKLELEISKVLIRDQIVDRTVSWTTPARQRAAGRQASAFQPRHAEAPCSSNSGCHPDVAALAGPPPPQHHQQTAAGIAGTRKFYSRLTSRLERIYSRPRPFRAAQAAARQSARVAHCL